MPAKHARLRCFDATTLAYLEEILVLDLEGVQARPVSSILYDVAEAVERCDLQAFLHLLKSATVRQYIHLTPCTPRHNNILYESIERGNIEMTERLLTLPNIIEIAGAHNNEILQLCCARSKTSNTEPLILDLLGLKNVSQNAEDGVVKGLIYSFTLACTNDLPRATQKMLTSTILLEHIERYPEQGLEALRFACIHGMHNVVTALMNTEIAKVISIDELMLAIINENTDSALALLTLPQVQAHAHKTIDLDTMLALCSKSNRVMLESYKHPLLSAYATSMAPVVASLIASPAVAARLRSCTYIFNIIDQAPSASVDVLNMLLEIVMQYAANNLISSDVYKQQLQRILRAFVHDGNNAAVQRVLTIKELLECDLSPAFEAACMFGSEENIALQLLPHLTHDRLSAIYWEYALVNMPRLSVKLLAMHDLLPPGYLYSNTIDDLFPNDRYSEDKALASKYKQKAENYVKCIDQLILAPCMQNRTDELLTQLFQALHLAELTPTLAEVLLSLQIITQKTKDLMCMSFVRNAIIFGHDDFALELLHHAVFVRKFDVPMATVAELISLSILHNSRFMLHHLIKFFIKDALAEPIAQAIMDVIEPAVNNKQIGMLTKQIIPLANKFGNLKIHEHALRTACNNGHEEVAMYVLSSDLSTIALCNDIYRTLWKAYELNMRKVFTQMCMLQSITEKLARDNIDNIMINLGVTRSYGKNQLIQQVLERVNAPAMVRAILLEIQYYHRATTVPTLIRLLAISQVRDYISNNSEEFVSIVDIRCKIFLAITRDLINMQALSTTYRTRVNKVCNAFDQSLKRCLAKIDQPSTNLLDQITRIDKIAEFLGLADRVRNYAIRDYSCQSVPAHVIIPSLGGIMDKEVKHAYLNHDLHAYALHMRLTRDEYKTSAMSTISSEHLQAAHAKAV